MTQPCTKNGNGHHVFWKMAVLTQRGPRAGVTIHTVGGQLLRVSLVTQPETQLTWWHHDADRLAAFVAHAEAKQTDGVGVAQLREMTLLSAASSVISVALDGRPSRCESFTYEDFLAQEAKKPKPKLRAVSAEEVRRAATGAGGFSAELVNGAGGWGLSGRRP